MILLITKQNCIHCVRSRILLQDHNYVEIDRNFVSSEILENRNGEYPMAFNLIGGYDELKKLILHSES